MKIKIMSQKQDNSNEFWVDTRAVTRTTSKMHRIRWTIETVSQLPDYVKIIGPDFYINETCVCNISFGNYGPYYIISLESKSNEDIKINISVILKDCQGNSLYHYSKEHCTLRRHHEISITGSEDKRNFNSLKDDVLIIDCSLNMEERVTLEKSYLKSEKESRANLVKDLKTMVNNPCDSDFTLKVGGKDIFTHKALLRARSPYFNKMFETKMTESVVNFVLITDVSHTTMLTLVEFLYTEDFTEVSKSDDIEQILELYFAASKYEAAELRAMCAEKLISIATTDSILSVLQLAQRHSDEELKMGAMQFISYHFDEIEKSDAWQTLISSEAALASEILNLCFKRMKISY